MRPLFVFLLLAASAFAAAPASVTQDQDEAAAQGGDSKSAGQHQPPKSMALGVVSGAVFDPSGAAIVGAQVTLSRADGKAVAHTTSGAAGDFRFDKLDLGKYYLEVQAEDFQRSRTDVAIGRKPAKPLRVVMAIAHQQQAVMVRASESSPEVSSEVSQNQNVTAMDRAALDRVPIFDQDYIATLSRFLDENATGTNGVSLIVNGIEANGPGVTPSAIQEVKINQNPYSALFARPGRARLEITTKSGTPDFHGTLNFMFRDSLFDARNAFATVKPQ